MVFYVSLAVSARDVLPMFFGLEEVRDITGYPLIFIALSVREWRVRGREAGQYMDWGEEALF